MSDNYTRLAVHNSACNEFYYKVQKCEKEESFINRALGKCAEAHVALSKCIRQNKHNLAAANREKSLIRQEKFKEKLKSEGYSNEL